MAAPSSPPVSCLSPFTARFPLPPAIHPGQWAPALCPTLFSLAHSPIHLLSQPFGRTGQLATTLLPASVRWPISNHGLWGNGGGAAAKWWWGTASGMGKSNFWHGGMAARWQRFTASGAGESGFWDGARQLNGNGTWLQAWGKVVSGMGVAAKWQRFTASVMGESGFWHGGHGS